MALRELTLLLAWTAALSLLTVVRSGKQYEELARNQHFGQTLASLAVCGESLLIRADRMLYCIGKPTQQP